MKWLIGIVIAAVGFRGNVQDMTAVVAPELDAVVHRATDYVTGYEAALGNVIGTEFIVENGFAKPPIESQMTVSYAPGKGVGILVPGIMLERHATEDNIIECRAVYSDFRFFQVDVKFEFDSPTSKPRPF